MYGFTSKKLIKSPHELKLTSIMVNSFEQKVFLKVWKYNASTNNM